METKARVEAKHKELINQYKTFEGIWLGTKDLILEAVDSKYLSKIKHETLGFLNQMAMQMIGELDFANTKDLHSKNWRRQWKKWVGRRGTN